MKATIIVGHTQAEQEVAQMFGEYVSVKYAAALQNKYNFEAELQDEFDAFVEAIDADKGIYWVKCDPDDFFTVEDELSNDMVYNLFGM